MPLSADTVKEQVEYTVVYYPEKDEVMEECQEIFIENESIDIPEGTFEKEEKIIMLYQEIRKLQMEHEETSTQIDLIQKEKNTIANTYEQCKNFNETLQQDLSSLKNEGNLLTEKNECLEIQLKAKSDIVNTLNEDLKRFRDDIQIIEKEKMELVNNLEKEKCIKTKLNEEIEKLELESLSKESIIQKMSDSIMIHEKEIKKLQNDLTESTQTTETLLNDKENLTKELNSINETEKFKNDKLKIIEQELEESLNRNQNLINDYDIVKKELDMAKESLQNITTQNNGYELRKEELLREKAHLDQRNITLAKDKLLLQAKLNQEFNDKNMTLKELHENMKYALTTKAKIIENKEESQAILEGKNVRLKEELKNLKLELENFHIIKKENENLKVELEKIKKAKESEENHAYISYEGKLISANENLNLQNQLNEFKITLSILETKIGRNLFDILMEKKIDIIEFLPSMSSLECSLNKETLENIFDKLIRQNEIVEKELKNLKTSFAELELKKEKIKKENEVMTENMNEKICQLRTEINLQKQSKAILQSEKDHLVEESSARQQTIDENNAYYHHIKKENQRILDELNRNICKTADTDREYQLLKEKFRTVEYNFNEKRQELECLLLNMNRRDEENNNLKEEIENMKLSIRNLKKENDLSKEKATISKNQNDELLSKIESYSQQIKKAQQDKMSIAEKLEEEIKIKGNLNQEVIDLRYANKLIEVKVGKLEEIHEQLKSEKCNLQEQKLASENELKQSKIDIDNSKTSYKNLQEKFDQERNKLSDELIQAKDQLERQNKEIIQINKSTEIRIKEHIETMKIMYENEKSDQMKLIADFNEKINNEKVESAVKQELEETLKKIGDLERNNKELTLEVENLHTQIATTKTENQNEITKINKDLEEKHLSAVDKLNYKIRTLTNELAEVAKQKEKLEIEFNGMKLRYDKILKEKEYFSKTIQDKEIALEEKDRFEKIKTSTHQYELEGVRLENNELNEQIKDLKYQLNSIAMYKNYEKEIYEQKRQLEMAMKNFEEEKSNFEANIEEIMIRTNEKYLKNESEKEESYTLKLLKTSQEERDKLSNELVNVNKELINTKNELRKLRISYKQKEEQLQNDEKELIMNIENDYKYKLDDMVKNHKKEIERIIRINNEERSKYEIEMKKIKDALQEENMKQLAEQRFDFEKELKQHVYQYLKEHQDDFDELNEKYEALKNEKIEMFKQFESEKSSMKRKYDSERYSLVETIRRLLKNVMKFKEQKQRLRHIHKDEITELEEKFEIERKKLEHRCEQEMEFLKENLHKSYNINGSNKISEQIARELQIPTNIKSEVTKPESDQNFLDDDLTLNELHELVRINDSCCENSNNTDTDCLRTQYEDELKKETEVLMKRLLEISDELDHLRANA